MINVYSPYLPAKVLKYAHLALDSTFIGCAGEYLNLVTESFKELLNVKHISMVNCGTSAVHLIAIILRKKSFNKIIVPNNTFIASWNPFIIEEFTLITSESDLDTWNYDLNILDNTIKLNPEAAVLVVHNIGNIIDVPALKLKYPNTEFVEDNCEGMWGKYNNTYSGTAVNSAVSFFANKILTSANGGMFITNNDNDFNLVELLRCQGQSKTRFIHEELGYNYRMSNIHAAILYGQLENKDEILELKSNIFDTYHNHFKDRLDIIPQKIDVSHSKWMFGIRLIKQTNYSNAEKWFYNKGIEIRPQFYAINAHKHLKSSDQVIIEDCSIAELLNKQSIILPSSPNLTKDEQKYIINCVKEYNKLL